VVVELPVGRSQWADMPLEFFWPKARQCISTQTTKDTSWSAISRPEHMPTRDKRREAIQWHHAIAPLHHLTVRTEGIMGAQHPCAPGTLPHLALTPPTCELSMLLLEPP
jgi:hypothetical protein